MGDALPTRVTGVKDVSNTTDNETQAPTEDTGNELGWATHCPQVSQVYQIPVTMRHKHPQRELGHELGDGPGMSIQTSMKRDTFARCRCND